MKELISVRGKLGTLHLDTTYCDPQYVFPSQERVLSWLQSEILSFRRRYPRSLII